MNIHKGTKEITIFRLMLFELNHIIGKLYANSRLNSRNSRLRQILKSWSNVNNSASLQRSIFYNFVFFVKQMTLSLAVDFWLFFNSVASRTNSNYVIAKMTSDFVTKRRTLNFTQAWIKNSAFITFYYSHKNDSILFLRLTKCV